MITLPHSPEAEEAILCRDSASINTAIDDLTLGLKPGDFCNCVRTGPSTRGMLESQS